MAKRKDKTMKAIGVLIAVSVTIFSLATAYYLLIAIPKQKKQQELVNARIKATSECQIMLDDARVNYAKLQTTEQDWINHGFAPRITDAEWKQYQSVFTPEWFQGCILKNLQNWGYSGK